MIENPPFPFIIGAGRSGSTLLRAMLDSHSAMAVPGETYLIDQLAQRADQFVIGERFDREAFEAELFGDARFSSFYLEATAVRTALGHDLPTDLASAFRSVYRAHAASVGKCRWADKTPAYAFAVERIAELFPEAVFIHLHRDPRDVVASYLDANWSYRTSARAAAYWRLSVDAATTARALGPERFMQVSYLDLADHPEETMRAICDFVELRFEHQMLNYQQGRVAEIGARTDGDAHIRLKQRPGSRRDWRTDLDPNQVTIVQHIAGETMEQLGYVPTTSQASGWQRATAALAVVATRAELAARNSRSLNRVRPTIRRLRGVGDHSVEAKEIAEVARRFASEGENRKNAA